MTQYKREAGDRWRIQVDEARRKGEHMYGPSTLISSDQNHPNTVVDEIVIGRHAWFHLEAMDVNSYWMNVAGLVVNVRLDSNGVPKQVSYELESPVEGCEYSE